ncbi:unannotated protein [freshwater metagenome]|uniref:Unannotated protein n=1 Tax=freshwater metagenome TaxID=449393 RepID=A0A6J7IXC8_9ZZZZ|nr:hypothetical protein [Actinomycetota bacterium]
MPRSPLPGVPARSLPATVVPAGPTSLDRRPHRALVAALTLAVLALLAAPALSRADYGGSWAPTGAMHDAHFRSQGVLLQDGRVLVAGGGGSRDGGEPTTAAEIFDPTTDDWTLVAPLRAKRSAATVDRLPDGRVLVAGGYGSGWAGIQSSTEIFDPRTETWSAGPPMHSPRAQAASAVLPDGRVLVAGGYYDHNQFVAENAEIYDPESNSWSPIASPLTPRLNARATALPDGRVLLTGGGYYTATLGSSEIYDPAANTWTWTPAGGVAQMDTSATLLHDGTILTTAGYRYPEVGTEDAGATYDPAANAWSPTPSPGPVRWNPTLTTMADGKALVAGGQGSDYYAQSSTALFDTARRTWRAAAPMGAARADSSAVLLRDGRVLVISGLSPSYQYLASAELFTPFSGPAPVEPPTVTGVAKEGSTLTAQRGTWSGAALSYRTQWRRCDADGDACSDIAGQTRSTYKPARADVGKRLRALITATRPNGGTTTASSDATEPIAGAGAPTITAAPVISGTPRSGETLKTTRTAFSSAVPFARKLAWQACDADGEHCVTVRNDNTSYVLKATLAGKRLRVQETATTGGGQATTATSELTQPVAGPAAPVNTVAPTIAGTPQYKTALKAYPGAWSSETKVTYRYNWMRCDVDGNDCAPLGVATSARRATAADIGRTLRVVVTAVDATGQTTDAVTEVVGPVTP